MAIFNSNATHYKRVYVMDYQPTFTSLDGHALERFSHPPRRRPWRGWRRRPAPGPWWSYGWRPSASPPSPWCWEKRSLWNIQKYVCIYIDIYIYIIIYVWLKPPCHAHLSCQVHKLRGMHPVAVWCQNIGAALARAAAGGEDVVDPAEALD